MREIFEWLIHSFDKLARTSMWTITLILTAVFSLVAVALTVFSTSAHATGYDAGRMAFSLVVNLAIVAAVFGIPATFVAIREHIAGISFLRTVLLSWLVGVSYLVAAMPAAIWALASTPAAGEIWLPIVSSTKFTVIVVAILVALAHWALTKDSRANATAIALVAGLAAGPLVVLGLTSFLPGVQQTISHSYIEWDKSGTVDPKTGYPSNPTCQPWTYEKKTVARFDLVGWVAELNPVTFVASSVTPTVATYQHDNTEMGGSGAGPEPTDLFAAVDLAVRGLQISSKPEIVIDECQNVKDYGTPYPSMYNTVGPKSVLAESRSGWIDGLAGQSAFVVVAAVSLGLIRRRSRRK